MRMCTCECTNTHAHAHTHTFTHSSQAIWLGLGQQGHLLFAIPVAMLGCTGGPSLEKAGGSCLHRLTPPLTRLCFPLTFHLSVTTSDYQKSLLGQALVSDMQAQEWVLPLPLRTEARRLQGRPTCWYRTPCFNRHAHGHQSPLALPCLISSAASGCCVSQSLLGSPSPTCSLPVAAFSRCTGYCLLQTNPSWTPSPEPSPHTITCI